MNIKIIGRLAGALGLTLALAGCIDLTSEVEVENGTNAKATTVTTMSAEFYPMIKAMKDSADSSSASSSDSNFCTSEGAQLVENSDGSATCTETAEGAFASIVGSSNALEDSTFTVVSPGVVRVAFKTEGMKTDLTKGQDPNDKQAMDMMKAYFDGHNATLRVKGKKITDTNLTLNGDGTSAEVVIPFTSLFDGTADLPPEYYAVVDTN